MSLTIISLFLLSGRVSLAPAPNGSPICEALEQHRYPQMGLLSITWYSWGKGLFLFTQPGYRYYDLPIEKVTFGSMDLTGATLGNRAEDVHYREAFGPVKEQTCRGSYAFFLYHLLQWSRAKFKLVLLIVTDRGTRSGAYPTDADDFTEITVSDGRPLPDFTLAGFAYDRSKDLSGYVLSADTDRFPGFITLSEYKVLWEGSNVTGLPLPAGQTDARPIWFLQVMDHPFEVFLVHSSNSPDPEAQLLRTVPRSFLFDKKHLVLFDSVNGCVHVIPDFAGFDVSGTKSRTFKRSNYPFEVYFKCGKPLDNPNPNRCNVVRGSHRPTGTTPENLETPGTESVVSFSKGATASICLLVAVLAVALLYAIMAKKKGKGGSKGRSVGKSRSASSSAISGKSKTGSKSMIASSSVISGHGAKSKSTSKVAKKGSKTSTSK